MNKLLSVILVLFLASDAFSGGLSKAYEALREYNYFEAKKLFEKGYKKDTVGAGYGLSTIYSRNDNPFFQADSALKFVLEAERVFYTLDEKALTKVFEYGVDSGEIADLKQRVSQLFYERALDSMTTSTFNGFIEKHPWYARMSLAIQKRDSLGFEDAQRKDTWQSYRYFFKAYPDARQVKRAQKRYDLLFYLDHTKDSTEVQFAQFVRTYPESPYHEVAQDMVYLIATRGTDPDDIHQFITRYPENRNVNTAWTRLYQISVTRNDPLEIANFILDYPDYPYREVALEDYNLSNEEFLKYRQNGKWGFTNLKGEIKIEAAYDWVESFSEGLALVGKGDYSGYINKRGEVVASIEYDDGGTFSQGFSWVEKDGVYGLINAFGKVVLPIEYDDLGEFSEGLIYVQKDAKYGFLNLQLKEALPFEFDRVMPFQAGKSLVTINYQTGLIDSTGEYVLPPVFDKLLPFGNDQFLRAEKDGLFGLFSYGGDTLLPLEYEYIGNYSEGSFVVSQGGKYGYMNDSLQWQIPANYSYSADIVVYAGMESGSVKYISKGKFGLHDSLGKKIYPAIFEDVGAPGILTPVKKRGLWGYANPDVRLVIGYKYQYAGPFLNGMARVKLNDKWGLLELSGKFILPAEYESIEYFLQDYLLVKKAGEATLVDYDLENVLPSTFDEITLVKDKLLLLEKAGKQAYYDLSSSSFVFKESGFVIP